MGILGYRRPDLQSTVALQATTRTLKNRVSDMEGPGMRISCLPITSEAMPRRIDFERLCTSKSRLWKEGGAEGRLLICVWELNGLEAQLLFLTVGIRTKCILP